MVYVNFLNIWIHPSDSPNYSKYQVNWEGNIGSLIVTHAIFEGCNEIVLEGVIRLGGAVCSLPNTKVTISGWWVRQVLFFRPLKKKKKLSIRALNSERRVSFLDSYLGEYFDCRRSFLNAWQDFTPRLRSDLNKRVRARSSPRPTMFNSIF